MKEKQKLDRRNTYTPTDAPQTRGNCDHALNREKTLSVPGLKTSSNNPDVDLQSGMTVRDLRVPVLNMRNQPLMPAAPTKARKLLKKGRAKVIQRSPFTIQLLYATGEAKQQVKLGTDPGSKYTDFSVVTERSELLSGDKEAPFMNVVKQKIAWLRGCETTPGSITKKNRISLGIEKTHTNDAFIIAGGSTQKRTSLFMVSQRRRNNRCLQLNRKGFKPSIRKRMYSLQLGAPVLFQKEEWDVVGIHSVGKQVIIKKGGKKMDVNVKKVQLRKYGKGLNFNLQFLPPLNRWVSLEVS